MNWWRTLSASDPDVRFSSALAEDEHTVFDFIEAMVAEDVDACGELLADDFGLHQVPCQLDTEGSEANVERLAEFAEAFSDYHATVEGMVAEGDMVSVSATVEARHTGPLRLGAWELAPRSERYEVPQFAMHRLRDGELAETSLLADAMGIAEQTKNLPLGPGAMLGVALRQIGRRLRGKPRCE